MRRSACPVRHLVSPRIRPAVMPALLSGLRCRVSPDLPRLLTGIRRAVKLLAQPPF
jgi:hypothetical protein